MLLPNHWRPAHAHLGDETHAQRTKAGVFTEESVVSPLFGRRVGQPVILVPTGADVLPLLGSVLCPAMGPCPKAPSLPGRCGRSSRSISGSGDDFRNDEALQQGPSKKPCSSRVFSLWSISAVNYRHESSPRRTAIQSHESLPAGIGARRHLRHVPIGFFSNLTRPEPGEGLEHQRKEKQPHKR